MGNKSDLSTRREVRASVAEEWAHSQGMDYVETSAVGSGGGSGRLRGALLTLTPPTEGEGELRRPAPQPGPELPLPLPGGLQHRPEPESGLPHLPTLGRPIVTTQDVDVFVWKLFGAKTVIYYPECSASRSL